jgi:hypothetical protein
MLDVYTVLQPWLGWVQAGFALAGGLLIWMSLSSRTQRAQGMKRRQPDGTQ